MSLKVSISYIKLQGKAWLRWHYSLGTGSTRDDVKRRWLLMTFQWNVVMFDLTTRCFVYTWAEDKAHWEYTKLTSQCCGSRRDGTWSTGQSVFATAQLRNHERGLRRDRLHGKLRTDLTAVRKTCSASVPSNSNDILQQPVHGFHEDATLERWDKRLEAFWGRQVCISMRKMQNSVIFDSIMLEIRHFPPPCTSKNAYL